MTGVFDGAALLARVVRGGVGASYVESEHRGHVVVVDAAGRVLERRGEPDADVLPRSSLKPVQAVAMLRAGVALTTPQLALATASHAGEPRHLDVARSTLEGAGLGPADLQTPPSLPGSTASLPAWFAAGRGPEPIAHTCSGKHAAMLATCVAAGWPTATYRDPGHPLQAAIRESLGDLLGEDPRGVAVDGCGAPAFVASLTGLARAFARLAVAPAGTPEAAVAAAMRAEPWLVAGTGRLATSIMTAVPGAIAKDGADGVLAVALPDGTAVAVKAADGAMRPCAPAVAAALRSVGAQVPTEWADAPVLGRGGRVGSVLAWDEQLP
ncbi:L-asparaginase II [Beutenbergia cavernae DSM 12333]|uniref:L-asparaginase II n=1 Tax=Beutenbergia cavernae (strain ATCC BAA-8 / DSM 12333 / CCUG 43141 / JCM 11478 / NBRC 16432 / NCIMB 13614 / HKI 0122) TaxID=471853 RepID=C5C227_BEUC1|nr:asparaginase [Beutenbergia cavernae]ACQ81652.1 L-asparaginase II [Beutenbergia cavernae DSM 12333]